MQFNSDVHIVKYVGSKYIVAISEDSVAQLMEIESGQVTHFK